MTREEKLVILKEWQAITIDFRDSIHRLEPILNLLIRHLEDFLSGLLELGDAYTEAIAEKIGDEEQWLDWYSYENAMGEKGLFAVFKDETSMKVETIEDLLELIEGNL